MKIQFTNDIQNYGPQILEYFRATGDRAGLVEQIQKLGVNDTVWNPKTQTEEAIFIPDRIAFTETDLTGDQAKETIIILRQKDTIVGIGEDTAIFVVGCQADQYTLMDGGNDFYLIGADPEGSGVADILDLNADGILDIILWDTYHWNSAHADVSYYYDALEWNGGAFRRLFELQGDPDHPKWIESFNQKLELQDVDGNGTIEMLFPFETPEICGSGPFRGTKDVFMWSGLYYRYMWTDPGIPEYRFQAALDGDYFAQIALYDKAERLYRKAIEDLYLKPFRFTDYMCTNRKSADTGDPQTIIAYARFRLMGLLAFLQKPSDAENEWIRLDTDFPEPVGGHQYAVLADAFWNAYQPDKNLDAACAAVRDEASKQPDVYFGPVYFGFANPGPTIETICPFHSDSGDG